MKRFKAKFFAASSQIAEIMSSLPATTTKLTLKPGYLTPRKLFQILRTSIRNKTILKVLL